MTLDDLSEVNQGFYRGNNYVFVITGGEFRGKIGLLDCIDRYTNYNIDYNCKSVKYELNLILSKNEKVKVDYKDAELVQGLYEILSKRNILIRNLDKALYLNELFIDLGINDGNQLVAKEWGKIKVKDTIKNGKKVYSNISDVNIIVPEKVIEVTFNDGVKEKAVCREPDIFSLEIGISICITKHLLGGTGAYNRAIRNGMKVYNNKLAKIERDKAEQERIKKRIAKREAYIASKKQKKEEAERERLIEIQKEAYLRALRQIDDEKFEAEMSQDV